MALKQRENIAAAEPRLSQIRRQRLRPVVGGETLVKSLQPDQHISAAEL